MTIRLGLFVWAIGAVSSAAGSAPHSVLLLPADQPATSQWVSWQTPATAEGQQIEWVAVHASRSSQPVQQIPALKHALLADLANNVWRVKLEQLQPATRYKYRVGMANQWSEWHSFTTAAAGFTPFTALYFGDAQNAVAQSVTPLFNQAFLQHPDAKLVVHAGDLIDRDTPTAQAWQEWFYAIGSPATRLNQFVIAGNHEYSISDDGKSAVLRPEFSGLFSVKRAGAAPWPDTTFSIIYQGVQFVALDTTALLYNPQQAAVLQQWLATQLAAGTPSWRVVVMHHPVYTFAANRPAIRDNRIADQLQAIFEKYQVDLVLQGHDHLYSRVSQNNVTYLVSVAGPKMNNLAATASNIATVSLANTQLFQRIHFNKDYLSVQVFDLQGQQRDQFVINK